MDGYFGAAARVTQTCTLAPGDPREAQLRCDAIQAEFRREQPQPAQLRREPPPLPKPLAPSDDQLRLRLAEEIDYARRMLEAMGDQLSADSAVVFRHSVALQSFDIVGQMLGHIATVIRSSDPSDAVQRIGMGELKARLLRRGGV